MTLGTKVKRWPFGTRISKPRPHCSQAVNSAMFLLVLCGMGAPRGLRGEAAMNNLQPCSRCNFSSWSLWRHPCHTGWEKGGKVGSPAGMREQRGGGGQKQGDMEKWGQLRSHSHCAPPTLKPALSESINPLRLSFPFSPFLLFQGKVN